MTDEKTPRPVRPIADVRLDGGRLCLDFVNTIHDRNALDVEDYIARPERFLEWCVRAGATLAGERVVVPADARRRAAWMRKASRLRHELHALLAARVDRVRPPAAAVRCLDDWLHLAWQSRSLGDDGQLRWRADARDELLPLKRIALDALDLLSGPAARQIRRCANVSSCGWLFVDTSKNQRRRWCAMQTCGTLMKMKRYRRGRR
jgi:predicted RNA-binding Zn ribbon-like protein